MHKTVSESKTGQGDLPPTPEERDQAYSSGAGRKAVEVPLPVAAERNDREVDESELLTAPIGLELETQAREIEEGL